MVTYAIQWAHPLADCHFLWFPLNLFTIYTIKQTYERIFGTSWYAGQCRSWRDY